MSTSASFATTTMVDSCKAACKTNLVSASSWLQSNIALQQVFSISHMFSLSVITRGNLMEHSTRVSTSCEEQQILKGPLLPFFLHSNQQLLFLDWIKNTLPSTHRTFFDKLCVSLISSVSCFSHWNLVQQRMCFIFLCGSSLAYQTLSFIDRFQTQNRLK